VVEEEVELTEEQRRLVEMIDRVCGDRIVLILNMFPAARSGWGFLAMNIFVRLSNEGRFCPVLTDKPEGEAFLTDYNLKSQFLTHYYNQEMISKEMRHHHADVRFLNCPVFHAIPGTFDAAPGYLGRFNFGYITVEQPSLREDEMRRSKDYDFIISPSNWNTNILRKHGFENVATVLQGIETDLFRTDPMPANVRVFSSMFVLNSSNNYNKYTRYVNGMTRSNLQREVNFLSFPVVRWNSEKDRTL
jgi:hypothetical protein